MKYKIKKIKNKQVNEENADFNKGNIVIYKTKSGKTKLEVRLEKETIWLTQRQIARLFDTERSVITKHLKNIFISRELNSNSVCAKIAHTAADGKIYITQFYNLDVIISVGYRVNSYRATQFRIWATSVLKDYLVQGYVLNQKRLIEQTEKIKELQQTIGFLKDKSSYPELKNQTQEFLNIVNEYAQSLTLLYKYDKGTIVINKVKKPHFLLTYENCLKLIEQAKLKLHKKNEATSLFGHEINCKFKSVIGALYQTFDKKELYATIEEKAANLLYLTIKDHPFSDGNKRIGSLFFLYYLERNNYLWKANNERKITDNTIVALALLIANSNPKEKEVMIKIITNLLK